MREAQDHRGHRIDLRVAEGALARGETAPVLLIDGEAVPYGQLPDGRYFLPRYAYDWHEDLVDLARSLIDYELKTSDLREGGPARGQ